MLIIPILAYAFINGILIKRQLSRVESFNPKPWAKAESILLFLVFTATAVLGQQSLPHDIKALIETERPSSLFTFFYLGPIDPNMKVLLEFNFYSGFFMILSLLFLSLILVSFIKKAPAQLSIVASILLVITSYLSFMSSI
ncbi:hypothetical protein ACOI1C_00250 [Bacillus sp. DJP31]|uniref:hypothetical protein n=1 Tax=Bacillus sp. DJP31 TaxID=3409789 RepID=UPI003BB7E8E6